MYKVAEVELIYRSKVKASERVKVSSSIEAYEIFHQYWDDDKIDLLEDFKVLFLNRANRCLGIFNLSRGGASGVFVDPKILFAAALRSNAASIILCHNHPSGNLNPSGKDIKLTKRIKQGCGFLDISLLDHLIITSEDYYSMADQQDL